jgi:hypothetical protein
MTNGEGARGYEATAERIPAFALCTLWLRFADFAARYVNETGIEAWARWWTGAAAAALSLQVLQDDMHGGGHARTHWSRRAWQKIKACAAGNVREANKLRS